jgi:hypothetical protein
MYHYSIPWDEYIIAHHDVCTRTTIKSGHQHSQKFIFSIINITFILFVDHGNVNYNFELFRKKKIQIINLKVNTNDVSLC